jgi:hypothetical protein
MFYISCISEKNPFLWFCVRCLLWELAIAFTGAIIAAISFLAHKLYKKVQGYWRNRQNV